MLVFAINNRKIRCEPDGIEREMEIEKENILCRMVDNGDEDDVGAYSSHWPPAFGATLSDVCFSIGYDYFP